MNRRREVGGERDGAREMESFSLSLATLCTNMINKKLVICCFCGALSSSPVLGKFLSSMPLRENFTK